MSRRAGQRHAWLLTLVAAGMFGFAFALVPLYEIFCEITGLNGKTAGQAALRAEITAARSDPERRVTLQFLGSVGRGLSWEFRPSEPTLVVRPGDMHTTTYYARNTANHTVVAQAVPSVSPGRAARFMKKVECFCFYRQELAAGEEIEMPVQFVVDAAMPDEIRELTLSYTMFPVTEAVAMHDAKHGE